MNLWKASDILVGRSGLCVWTKPFNCEPNVLSFCFLFTHFAAALMAEFPSGIRKVMTGGGGRGGEWDQAAVVWWGLGLSWPELRPACRSSTRWSPDRPGRLGWWAYRELEASSLAGHLQHAHTNKHTHIYIYFIALKSTVSFQTLTSSWTQREKGLKYSAAAESQQHDWCHTFHIRRDRFKAQAWWYSVFLSLLTNPKGRQNQQRTVLTSSVCATAAW